MLRHSVIPLHPGDANYPRRLRDLGRPPDPLWVSGDPGSLNTGPAVAIVGTRRLTLYGERLAREISTALARSGVVVVSGLAQGIDSEAHRAALDAGGLSIAVLGEGLAAFDGDTRGRRRVLATRIRTHGALLSEYDPAVHARGWMFARRNTTIAALADAVVIVEAGEGSGALITASEARVLGRPLYAIPGPVGASRSVGTNALLESGAARALARPERLIADLGLSSTCSASAADGRLGDLLAAGPLSTDAVARGLRMPESEAAALLAAAVLRGEVVLTGDGRIARR